MIFNINNHTSHSWMSFVNLHVGCISMLNHIPTWKPIGNPLFFWTVNFGTMFTLLLFFVDTSIVLHTYRTHSAKSDPTILSPKSDERKPTSVLPTPKPFINWGMKNTMVKPMNCRVEPQKPPEKKRNRLKTHITTSHCAPRTGRRGFGCFGCGVDCCFFHSNLFVGCGWRLKVCNKMHLNHLTSFSKIYIICCFFKAMCLTSTTVTWLAFQYLSKCSNSEWDQVNQISVGGELVLSDTPWFQAITWVKFQILFNIVHVFLSKKWVPYRDIFSTHLVCFDFKIWLYRVDRYW